MKNRFFLVIPLLFGVMAIIIIFLTGCIPSLHPLYTNENIVFDANLVGSWQNEEEEWVLEKMPNATAGLYNLTITSHDTIFSVYHQETTYAVKQKTGKFEVVLLKLKNYYFLDFFPQELEDDYEEFYLFHLVSAHTFARVWICQDEVDIFMLNPNWVKNKIKKHAFYFSSRKLN